MSVVQAPEPATGAVAQRVAGILHLDAPAEVERIVRTMREQVRGRLRRRGVVVGVSGGVDSAVVCLLGALAFGPGHCLALSMPERAGESTSVSLARQVATRAGVRFQVVPVGGMLDAAGCEREQEAAIRTVLPAFGAGWRMKLAVSSPLEGDRLRITTLVARAPDGTEHHARLGADAYRHLVAATNMKQRVRKQVEYFWADRLGYAVAGTPNRLEYDQGFFVKNGDGAADLKPIAHLLKTSVYQLARELGVPEEIRSRTPTTETFALQQSQEEFYFGAPLWVVDLCMHGLDRDLPVEWIAAQLELRPEQVRGVQQDLLAKRRATRYLHEPPLLVEREA